ncbi:hypothetical protein EDB81DRAFT_431038 [Dactylonectria macrodidyma]|uniref:Uncharacterized protein n=1 Tax=Dactylonectria macrodidyma TaxID=307937 RepID=A0A9P9I5S2_9HYPO|nr:hypothetical protein EDB81DRAFT_431038 [Dactylonectria macrodidyma]
MSRERGESIKSLVRAYPNERLLVIPPLWTRRHLDLLKCRFETDTNKIHTASVSTYEGHRDHRHESDGSSSQTWFAIPSDAELLSKSQNLKMKRSAMGRLLAYPESLFRESSDILRFFYAKRPVYQQRLLVFLLQGGNHINSCPVVYVDYADITASRTRLLRSKPDGNVILKELQDWTEDPILVSIMISVAQKQAHPSISHLSKNAAKFPSSSRESAILVPRLLVTNREDIENIHFYEALVPRDFLRKFDQPRYRSPDGISMKHLKIPFKPYESLADRVITLLIKSPFLEHRKIMDIYGKAPTNPENDDKKRKRGMTEDHHDIGWKKRSRQ